MKVHQPGHAPQADDPDRLFRYLTAAGAQRWADVTAEMTEGWCRTLILTDYGLLSSDRSTRSMNFSIANQFSFRIVELRRTWYT